MKIYITGVSGVGKTSVAEALAKEGVYTVDTDNLSHWENKHTGEHVDWAPGMSDEWHQSHVYLCDIEALKRELASAADVVVAGNGYNQDDYIALFDKVFVLHCSPETVVARIDARTNNDYGKHEQERRHILEWQQMYDTKMVERGAIQLDGDKPLSDIIAHIRRHMS